MWHSGVLVFPSEGPNSFRYVKNVSQLGKWFMNSSWTILAHYSLVANTLIALCINLISVKSKADESRYEFQADLALRCSSDQHAELTRQIRRRATEITGDLHCLQQGTCTLNEPHVAGCGTPGRTKRDVFLPSHSRWKREDKEKVHISVTITYHGDEGKDHLIMYR